MALVVYETKKELSGIDNEFACVTENGESRGILLIQPGAQIILQFPNISLKHDIWILIRFFFLVKEEFINESIGHCNLMIAQSYFRILSNTKLAF